MRRWSPVNGHNRPIWASRERMCVLCPFNGGARVGSWHEETEAVVGAEQASYQPQEHVRVMLDPAGHPFCLYVDVSTS
jgi:hypothetical protein